MSTAGKIPSKKPKRKKLSAKAIVIALDGRERDFPVYHFSGREIFEPPNHNPFKGILPD